MNSTRKLLLPGFISSSLVEPPQNILERKGTTRTLQGGIAQVKYPKSEILWDGNEGNRNFLDQFVPPGLCSPSATPTDPGDNGMPVPLGKALVHQGHPSSFGAS